MSLEIVSQFGGLSLQAAPRYGRRHFGVAPGGAFDQESFLLANALVGNFGDEPALELANCTLTILAKRGLQIAWVGAGASQAVELLEKGESRTFKAPATGCRSYLAVSTGFHQTDEKAFETLGSMKMVPRRRLAIEPVSLLSEPLQVLRGPKADLLNWSAFLATHFVAGQAMDRTGVRIQSQNPEPHCLELPSEPSIMGAIQLLPSGDAIILGPDGPTIGGYPKIAVVAGISLNRVAQLRPGDVITFQRLELEDAQDQLREATLALGRTLNNMKLATQ